MRCFTGLYVYVNTWRDIFVELGAKVPYMELSKVLESESSIIPLGNSINMPT